MVSCLLSYIRPTELRQFRGDQNRPSAECLMKSYSHYDYRLGDFETYLDMISGLIPRPGGGRCRLCMDMMEYRLMWRVWWKGGCDRSVLNEEVDGNCVYSFDHTNWRTGLLLPSCLTHTKSWISLHCSFNQWGKEKDLKVVVVRQPSRCTILSLRGKAVHGA
jgi:hypothetical protein